MRGFALVLSSVLLVIGAGAAVSSSSSHGVSGTTAEFFAHRVLEEASIPPGARQTSTVVSSWLIRPLETPGLSPLVDLHRLYRVGEQPGDVVSYVRAHLPKGAMVTSTASSGGPAGSTSGLVTSLPISGPNEHLAQLAYDVAPDGASGSELRVDAQTVWLPGRAAGEISPSGGIVEVTGFEHVSLQGSSGPVTVRLGPDQAARLRVALDALPRGPSAFCQEDAMLYKVVFRPAPSLPASFEALGEQCGATVLVTAHGETMPPLYDTRCSLLRAVKGFLPAHEADGTRSASAACAP